MYNDKLVNESRLVAIKIHGNQDYDGIFPYEKHLQDVVNVLKRFDRLVQFMFTNKIKIVNYNGLAKISSLSNELIN